MAKTEDIEAKIATYVDGELDDAGRAEIEKHLAGNPSHRQLLQELIQQRDLLRSLPHEMAPADVAETINSQLERAVLLGDVDGDSQIAGRIGFWRQLRVIAAMLILTASLAGVIYYLLPSTYRSSKELADLRIPPPPEIANTDLASKPLDDSLLLGAPRQPSTAESIAEADRLRTQLAMGNEISPTGRDAGESAAKQAEIPQIASNAASAREEVFRDVIPNQNQPGNTKASQAPFVYVVSTDNPGVMERDLKRYLSDNKITWEPQTEPMPLPLDIGQQQSIFGSRMQQQTVQLKSAGGAAPASSPAIAEQQPAPVAGYLDTMRLATQTEQQIVARQVTRQQAVDLRAWLDLRQAQTRLDKASNPEPQAVNLVPQPEIGRVTLTWPTTSSADDQISRQADISTTQPASFAVGLTSFLDFSPPRLDAPGFELKSKTFSTPTTQSLTLATTQPQISESNIGVLAAAPPTEQPVAAELINVLIVLAPPTPTTQPATQPGNPTALPAAQ